MRDIVKIIETFGGTEKILVCLPIFNYVSVYWFSHICNLLIADRLRGLFRDKLFVCWVCRIYFFSAAFIYWCLRCSFIYVRVCVCVFQVSDMSAHEYVSVAWPWMDCDTISNVSFWLANLRDTVSLLYISTRWSLSLHRFVYACVCEPLFHTIR